jgi:DNA-directed RNA polymerase specialized sigma24 family protein
MNINKIKMREAYDKKADPVAFNELIGYFYELANFFVSKAGISSYYREDYVQLAVERAINKIDLYNPTHVNKDGNTSAVFSYFYKLIYMEIRYRMRETRLKRECRPSTCSFEAISAIIEDKHSENNVIMYTEEESEKYILIDGRVFNRNEVIEAIQKAKKLLSKSKKNASFVPDTNDEIVLEFYNKLKGRPAKVKA